MPGKDVGHPTKLLIVTNITNKKFDMNKFEQMSIKKEEPSADYSRIENKLSTPMFKNKYLFDAFSILTTKIKDEMKNYDVILSDDASGRLVSLIFKDLINKERKAAGKEDAKIYFVSLYSYSLSKNIKKYGEALKDIILGKVKGAKRVLIPTEYISTGSHFTHLLQILDEQNIDYDVAAITCKKEVSDEQKIKNLKFGDSNTAGLNFFCNYSYGGVKKGDTTKLVQDELLGEYRELPERQQKMRRIHPQRFTEEKLHLSEARHDAKIYAEELGKILE